MIAIFLGCSAKQVLPWDQSGFPSRVGSGLVGGRGTLGDTHLNRTSGSDSFERVGFDTNCVKVTYRPIMNIFLKFRIVDPSPAAAHYEMPVFCQALHSSATDHD